MMNNRSQCPFRMFPFLPCWKTILHKCYGDNTEKQEVEEQCVLIDE